MDDTCSLFKTKNVQGILTEGVYSGWVWCRGNVGKFLFTMILIILQLSVPVMKIKSRSLTRSVSVVWSRGAAVNQPALGRSRLVYFIAG